MTEITFELHGGYIGITASGHSGYADIGSDIVCAGVSTILLAFREACEELAEEEKIIIHDDNVEDGFLSLVIYDPHDNAKWCFNMVKYAITSISEQYPANLSVEWDER